MRFVIESRFWITIGACSGREVLPDTLTDVGLWYSLPLGSSSLGINNRLGMWAQNTACGPRYVVYPQITRLF